MKESFIEKRFNHSSLAIISNANAIIREHQAEGYTLTLRQLYYQFVNRKLIQNKQSEYKRIGNVINEARLAGLIDWNAIEDRMRFLRSIRTFHEPAHFMQSQVGAYAHDLWAGQQNYCEVWIEKDVLSGIIERPCVRYRVPFFACQGYASQSGLYEAGKRLRHYIDQGRIVTVFHLGDHDPSGLDMSRDNDDRLNMFTRTLAGVRFVRLGLNRDQIDQFNLPPDPTKITDSRAALYMGLHGNMSWELDALPSREIERLVVSSIVALIDTRLFDQALDRETESRKQLQLVAMNWNKAVNGAKNG